MFDIFSSSAVSDRTKAALQAMRRVVVGENVGLEPEKS